MMKDLTNTSEYDKLGMIHLINLLSGGKRARQQGNHR